MLQDGKEKSLKKREGNEKESGNFLQVQVPKYEAIYC